MYVFQVYLQTIAWALQKDPIKASPNHQPCEDGICGPASIINYRASGTYDWHPHYQNISVRRSVCGSIIWMQLHAPPEDRFI